VTNEETNPYASPVTESVVQCRESIDPALLKKIEAVIKDAGQFWLAIIACILCTWVGAIIIGPWYLARLFQWNAIAKAQPMLLAPNVPRGSVAQRFQASRIKLIIGMVMGGLILAGWTLLLAGSVLA
jgi:hypothetical protein